MRTLEIAPTKWQEPSFGTAAEAIAYRSPHAARAASDTASLQGAAIRSAKYNDCELRLLLSDERTLRIYLDGDRVEWELCAGYESASDDSWDQPAPCLMRYVNTEISDSIWDRPSLLEQRIGQTIYRIYASAVLLFLYVTANEILMFCPLQVLPDNKPLLHWSETD